jgi:hypothetical protein
MSSIEWSIGLVINESSVLDVTTDDWAFPDKGKINKTGSANATHNDSFMR